MSNNLARIAARLALPVLLVAVAAPTARAQDPTPPQQTREHVVRRGDTLWDLARAYLSNPFLWPMIYEANRTIVENPHWIYPLERLIIPPVVAETPVAEQPLGVPVPEPQPQPPMPVAEAEFLPETEEPADTAETVVETLDFRRPIVPVAEWLAAPWISATAESNVTGRVIRPGDPAAENDRLPSTLHPHERVHIGAMRGAPQVGDSLMIVRFERQVEPYGRIVVPLGVLLVDTVTPTVATARVIRQFGDAQIGDAVMPLGAIPEIGLGRAEPVEGGAEGRLLDFLMQDPLKGTTDVAFVSLGQSAGVGIGDEFAVYVPARSIDNEREERLPPTQVGTVRVIRVGDSTATVRVLGVTSAALRGGLPVQLVRRMP